MNYLLFNPLANNGTGLEAKNACLPEVKSVFSEITEINVLDFEVESFISELKPTDNIILVGGDGTLNHLANNIYGRGLENKFYLYKAGTGNDFLKDILPSDSQEKLIDISKYLKRLPMVSINGKTTRFINGVGFGIDGMVCEVADGMKAKGKKKINYTGIAIKLLLFKFKCPDATVYIDGKEFKFKKAWIASAMNGRYYGGGMMPAPKQNRNDRCDHVSLSLLYGSGKLKTLMMFPSLFKGEHVKYKNHVAIFTGKNITVEFDRPVALQIDGETILDVSSYEVKLGVHAKI